VEGAIDYGCDDALGIMRKEGLFEDTLAGAGFAEEQAQPALLGVDEEDVEDLLLVRQQGEGFGGEGMALEAKVRTKHG